MQAQDEPDGDVAQLLRVMAGMDTAAPTVEELEAASGLERDAFDRALVRADIAGLIVPWEESPDGSAVMLTPLSADRLRLRIEEVGGASGRYLFRWVPGTNDEPKAWNDDEKGVLPGSVCAGDEMSVDAFWGMIPDIKAREPVDLVAMAEAFETGLPATAKEYQRSKDIYPPAGLILLGLRPTWPGPAEPDGPCIGCGGRLLFIIEYCCRCERSGIDHLIPPPSKRALANLYVVPGLEGGIGDLVSRSKASGRATAKPKSAKARRDARKQKADRAKA